MHVRSLKPVCKAKFAQNTKVVVVIMRKSNNLLLLGLISCAKLEQYYEVEVGKASRNTTILIRSLL